MAKYERVNVGNALVYVRVEERNEKEIVHAIQYQPQGDGRTLIDVGGFITTDTTLALISEGKYATKGATRNQTMAFFLNDMGMEEMCDGHTHGFYDLDDLDAVAFLGILSRVHGFDI